MNANSYVIKRRFFTVIKYSVLILFLAVEIFPLLTIIANTFTPIDEIGKNILFPSR